MENSKAIKGFEDYLISSDGKVFSLKRNKYLKPFITGTGTGKGYYWIGLWKSGKCYRKSIARLIAQTFILNPDDKPQVNHIDGNKLNNDVSNLEWMTQSENMKHAYANKLREPSPNVGRHKIPVKVYDYKTGEYKSTQPSLRAAARVYGLFVWSISCVLTGRCKQAKGLTFEIIIR